MEIAYYGKGRVGSACREVISRLGITETTLDDCDFLISVHWDKIFTKHELEQPRLGALNLHNSYLPWNRGAHACTWAIVDQTPHGATMHWLDGGIDTGSIYHRERLQVREGETADELYQRTAELEVKVFAESMRMLKEGNVQKIPQVGMGSYHRKADFERLVNAVRTSDTIVVRR